MTGSGDDDLFSRDARRREDLLTAFEADWLAGRPPDLPAFVRKRLPPWLPGRDAVVAELIRIDQEFRIKRGKTAPVEDYVARLPGYEPSREDLADLLRNEFHLRSRFQVPPAADEIARRFPGSADASAEPGPDGVVLYVVAGPHRGTAIRLEPGRTALVGRAGGADVRLDADSHLSRFHLRLELVDGAVRFHDLNSRNGTSLNGAPVASGRLNPGDTLRCGRSEIAFAAAADATCALPPAAAPPKAADPPGYRLAESLGQGLLGERYRGEQLSTRKPVVVQWIDVPGAASKVPALIRETSALAAVAGSTLLLPLDVGLVGGRPYVVTPRHVAASFAQATADLSPDARRRAACRVIGRTLHALARAHAIGLVHGGLGESNLLLERTSGGVRVKVAEFGLARLFLPADREPTPADDLRAAGRLLGRFLEASGSSDARLADLVRRMTTDPPPGDAASFAAELKRIRTGGLRKA